MRKRSALIAVFIFVLLAFASLAYLNFRSFMERSKSAEARGNLAGIVAAEKAFHQEWGRFDADLNKIGFQPASRLDYVIGFNPECTGAAQPAQFDTLFRLLPCPDKANFVLMAIRPIGEGFIDVVLTDKTGVIRTKELGSHDSSGLRIFIRESLR